MPPTSQQLELIRRASGLTLDAEGELQHEGDPILHPGLHALFQSGLDVLPTGEAIVRVGDQWAYVLSPGSPFVVQRLWVDGAQVALDLNTGETVHMPAECVQLRLRGEHELTVALPQPGRIARFGRRAWHGLADGFDMAEDGGVWLHLGPHRLLVQRGEAQIQSLALPLPRHDD